MRITYDLKEINEILNTYNGDTARIWLFDITHVKLAIKVYSNKNKEIIYLVMAGCHYIKGDFSLEDPQLWVNKSFNTERLENEYRIMDTEAGFELIGNNGIVLAKALESEFGDSFENFLKDTE